MKKILPLVALCALTGFARAATISGTVSSASTCGPVSGQKVYASDSMMTWIDSAVTNSSGFYSITVPASVGTTYIQEWANACGSQYRSNWTAYSGSSVTLDLVICGSAKVLEGQVRLGNATTTTGPAKVWLIRRDVNPSTFDTTLTAIDSMQTYGSGQFRFQYPCIPAGTLLLKGALLPAHPSYASYLPTYQDSSLNWNGAAPLTSLNFSGYWAYVHLKSGTNPGGAGFIGGSVLLGANKSAAVGDPLSGRTLILTTASGQAIAETTSDASGKFRFNNLTPGNYKVFGDAWGKYNPELTVTLSAALTSVSNIVFEENSKTFEGKFVNVGVGRINGLAGLSVFPNPAASFVNINGLAAIKGEKQIKLTDVTGKVIIHQTTEDNTSLNTSELPSGVYMLQIQAASGNASFQIAK